MIDPIQAAVIFAGYIILFFSVHLYMDIQMFRSKPKKSVAAHHLIIPAWAKISAFTPSLIFWALFFAAPLLFYTGWYARIPFFSKFPYENLFQGTGFTLIFLGVVLADWGRVSRGVCAPSNAMPEDYTLSQRGAYHLVRHPMYVSYSLFFVGIPLALLNILLCVCILGIFGYYRIAQEEEKVLIEKFGEEYRKYQKEVGMFMPKFWYSGE
jgi:protein-S-isoprenylcysteine O-methyltransferase Ste14